jgi:hypothetical protein
MHGLNYFPNDNRSTTSLYNERFPESENSFPFDFAFGKIFFQNMKSFTNLMKNYITYGMHIDERTIQNLLDLKLKKIEMFTSDRNKFAEKWGFDEPCSDGIGRICAMAKTQIQINQNYQSVNRTYQLLEPNKCYI